MAVASLEQGEERAGLLTVDSCCPLGVPVEWLTDTQDPLGSADMMQQQQQQDCTASDMHRTQAAKQQTEHTDGKQHSVSSQLKTAILSVL